MSQVFKNIVIIYLVLLPFVVVGQDKIQIGSKYLIESEILGDIRQYWVYVPNCYNQQDYDCYDVIYVLDAEIHYHSVVATMKSFSNLKDKRKESTIVVGIVSKDRDYDFTPTGANTGRSGKENMNKKKIGGGAEKYHNFLTMELVPIIETHYRTNQTNILIGHSYSALFALYSLSRQDTCFDRYIAIDPSLWWDNGKIVETLMDLKDAGHLSQKQLYVGLSTKKRLDRNDDIIYNLADRLLYQVLPDIDNLDYRFKVYPEENHGTVALPGIYDGLKFMYRR